MNIDKKDQPYNKPKLKDDDEETCSELDAITTITPRENNEKIFPQEKAFDNDRPAEKDLTPSKDD